MDQEQRPQLHPLSAFIVSFFWGLAEAVLFFIAPEVYLTRVVLRSLSTGLVACGFALLGSCVGAALLYWWATSSPDTAQAVISGIPGVDAGSIKAAYTVLKNHEFSGPFIGILSGKPFKVYVLSAAMLHQSMGLTLLLSLPPLLVRYLVITGIFRWIGQRYWAGWELPKKYLGHAIFWIVFYILYFAIRGIKAMM